MTKKELFEIYRQSPYYEFDRRMAHKNVFVTWPCTKKAVEYYWNYWDINDPMFS